MDFDLPLLFQDDDLLVINKPAGILVHRSEATSRREPAILQIMRDRMGQHLYPVHRLDRPTSGVLILARSPEMAAALSQRWTEFEKSYLAIVRGWTPERLTIDRALPDLDDPEAPPQDARTELQRLATIELDESVDRYPKTRYSLCRLQPQTGRRHQLRRHCKSLFHPMIGDTVYGQGAHNRFFRDSIGVSRLLLHHQHMAFRHPRSGAMMEVEAGCDNDWQTVLRRFHWTSAASL